MANDAKREIVADAGQFFDCLSGLQAGAFATIGYVTGANLTNLPKGKRLNPTTKRMNSFVDYEAFGKTLGFDNVGGIVKLTSYTLNWSTPDSIAKAYGKYKTNFDALRGEYGIAPTENRKSWTQKQDYGKNGLSVYGGDNEELRGRVYTAQNTHNATITSTYYLIDTEGRVIDKCDKEKLVDYLKQRSPISGVKELREMGADEARIKEYIDKELALGMRYQEFEASNILYMVGTSKEDRRKFIYINDRLSQCVKDVNIIPAEFTKIAKERYDIDLYAYDKKFMNESVDGGLFWLI